MPQPRFLTAIPVYNEQAHIVDVLDAVRRYAGDIVVVDDGSTDGTADILALQTDVHVITHEVNRGYGAALKSAFDYAVDEDYDVLVTIDCDGQHEPRLIPELVAEIVLAEQPAIDIVSGSRYLQSFEGDNAPPEERRRINLEITRFLNTRLGMSLTDAFCGFKAYRMDALRAFSITEPGYAMPLQLWAQAVAAGLRIVEFAVPRVYLEEKRSFGGSLDDGRQRMAYYMQVLQRELAAREPCRDSMLESCTRRDPSYRSG